MSPDDPDGPPRRPLYVNNAAARLGRPARTVRDWAKKGRLPGYWEGRLWRFDPLDVDALKRELSAGAEA
jgi:excisionase family DNA binding protein